MSGQVTVLDAERRPVTVGGLAEQLLLVVVGYLEARHTLAGMEGAGRDVTEVYRRIATAVGEKPLRSARRILKPTDLDGRFETHTQSVFLVAEVASCLLDDAAQALESMRDGGGEARCQWREDAHAFRYAARLLSIAPNAWLGARLNELLPCLHFLHLKQTGYVHPPSMMSGREGGRDATTLMEDSAFAAVVRDAYAMRMGDDFDMLPDQVRAVWVLGVAEFWGSRHQAALPLRGEELERIAHDIRNPRGPWCRMPLMVGAWRELDADDAEAVLRLIGTWHRVGSSRAAFPVAYACDRVRIRQLACHQGVVLVEVQGRTDSGETGIASFLLAEDAVHAIDGASAWLHDLNDLLGVHLDSDEARLDYLRLFTLHVHADEGPFLPLESLDVLPYRAEDADMLKAVCAPHVKPVMPCGFDGEGRRLFRTSIVYGNALFKAVFAMAPDGTLEMVDDEPVAVDLPVQRLRLRGLLLISAD